MNDRLTELLAANPVLYGLICRDATGADMELMAQTGYHVVFLDMEHGAPSEHEVVRLGRTAAQLGMVPLVRIPELTRTHVQRLLDAGIQVINLPDVRSADEAAELVRLGKYPPLGERGVSTTAAGMEHAAGGSLIEAQQAINAATHLMVMIESDQGFEELDAILRVDGVDIVTVGVLDWSTSLGLEAADAQAQLTPKIEHVLRATVESGKIASMSATDAAQARQFAEMGVRLMFVGVDLALKRRALAGALASLRETLEQS